MIMYALLNKVICNCVIKFIPYTVVWEKFAFKYFIDGVTQRKLNAQNNLTAE